MHSVHARKFQSGQVHEVEDTLTEEALLRISINQQPYTITMRSPGDEQALVRGILHTENVVNSPEAVINYSEIEFHDNGSIAHVSLEIPTTWLGEGISQTRNLMSVTSCGMCGKTDELLLQHQVPLDTTVKLKFQEVLAQFVSMRQQQTTFTQSGGSHAAAAYSHDQQLLTVMEDIGRHNAVDKVIGDLLNHHQLNKATSLIVSGRISYEIVSKCYRAGIPFLAAVSAPSSLAVSYCRELGICLMGFCREDKLTVYTFPERIQP